jgi:protein-disulfide isomerase
MRALLHAWRAFILVLGVLAGFTLGLATPPAGAAPAPGSSADLEALKAEQARLQTELEGLKTALEQLRHLVLQRLAPPPPAAAGPVSVRVGGSPLLGHPDAPLTLVEFSDYQCPYCARFAQTILPALKAAYIDTGQVRYVFRDFPLDRSHPQARQAAEAAHCAGEQGQYWAMHDVLFRHPQALAVEQLTAYAQRLDLDLTAFERCLAQGQYAAVVQQNYAEGIAVGVRGTPAFFLGKTRPDGTIEGLAIRGAQPFAAFQQAIERLLAAP